MNLYLISQDVDGSPWDRYVSAVVAAESEDAARAMHPNGLDDYTDESWCDPKDVSVRLIGKAEAGISGVVLAYYYHG